MPGTIFMLTSVIIDLNQINYNLLIKLIVFNYE